MKVLLRIEVKPETIVPDDWSFFWLEVSKLPNGRNIVYFTHRGKK